MHPDDNGIALVALEALGLLLESVIKYGTRVSECRTDLK